MNAPPDRNTTEKFATRYGRERALRAKPETGCVLKDFSPADVKTMRGFDAQRYISANARPTSGGESKPCERPPAGSRAKAQQSIRRIASDPSWREKVSRATKAAMRRPEVRDKHLSAMEGQPTNFKGGNGRPLAERVEAHLAALQWLGWIPEFVIKTRGHGTGHKAPTHYKADWRTPRRKSSWS